MQGDEPDAFEQAALEKRFSFVMISTRVFLNVHYDFEVEPDLMLPSGKQRKKVSHDHTHGVTAKGAIGFDPFDVFDLWQRNLNRTLGCLERDAAQRSEVLEAVVRMLSKVSPLYASSSLSGPTHDGLCGVWFVVW